MGFGRNKTFTIAIAATSVFVVMLAAFSIQISGSGRTNEAIALPSECQTISSIVAKTQFSLTIPDRLGERPLRCASSSGNSVMLAYSKSPLDDSLKKSMLNDRAVAVLVTDATFNGTVKFDAQDKINKLQNTVGKNRPDLRPTVFTINNHPAWGTEGGDDAQIIVVSYTNGTELARHMLPAPSSLMMFKDDISYRLDGYMPLSELVKIAEDLG